MARSQVLRIDETDPTPPFEQIRRQIVAAIDTGALGEGDRLAPVRQLAGDLGVAPGTVARAYRELESAGYVLTRRGGGTRVAPQSSRPAPQVFQIFDESVASPQAPHTQRIAAYGVARRGDDVLLVRSSAQSKLAGQWFLPGGGIEWGESPEETMVREFREETGLEVAVGELLDVSSAINVFADETLHTIRVIYRANVSGGALRPEANGTTDVAEWVPIARAETLNLADFVHRALARV